MDLAATKADFDARVVALMREQGFAPLPERARDCAELYFATFRKEGVRYPAYVTASNLELRMNAETARLERLAAARVGNAIRAIARWEAEDAAAA